MTYVGGIFDSDLGYLTREETKEIELSPVYKLENRGKKYKNGETKEEGTQGSGLVLSRGILRGVLTDLGTREI